MGESEKGDEMTKSKYEQMASVESSGPIFNRYGFSEMEWAALSVEQREVHYNRQKVCSHAYKYDGPFPEDTSETSLRRSYSFDPYAHTAHMEPCVKASGKCMCQMCAQKIGVAREGRF